MNEKEQKGQNSLPEEKKLSSNEDDLGAGIYAPLRKKPERQIKEYSFSKGDDVLG